MMVGNRGLFVTPARDIVFLWAHGHVPRPLCGQTAPFCLMACLMTTRWSNGAGRCTRGAMIPLQSLHNVLRPPRFRPAPPTKKNALQPFDDRPILSPTTCPIASHPVTAFAPAS